MSDVVLEVKNLRTYFHTDEGVIPAVDGVDFTLTKGKTLCVVGESGCGKSVTAFSVMRLIPMPPGKVESGEILYNGKNIVKLTENEMRGIRGNEIAMIFQEPMTSLNPVYTIGNQIVEAIVLHQKVKPKEARQRAIKMLEKVGLPDPQKRIDEYPHQMSGGMKQRVMIAMALSCNPEILIADEPTTALDVTIQAQILDLLKQLKETEGMSIMLITHDLAVVSEVADEVLVMYASKVVENAGVDDIFNDPKHPYTQGLIKAIPKLGNRVERLNEIPGQVPRPQNYPEGCHFAERCPRVMDICHEKDPGMTEVGSGHLVSCFIYEGEK
ncbi:MAG: ABC transporter ATP-binding protein [Candidatus Brocadiaceae bacterium]|nr:ABC transporter ATP-binding protein [Candidatus Brocadiaceae bacterium]